MKRARAVSLTGIRIIANAGGRMGTGEHPVGRRAEVESAELRRLTGDAGPVAAIARRLRRPDPASRGAIRAPRLRPSPAGPTRGAAGSEWRRLRADVAR